jgi:YidC/Oxa1 family membrane protein insertase
MDLLTVFKSLLVSSFNLFLYNPLLNILLLLYRYLPGHDFGIAVIVLTILIRIILYPLGNQAIRSQKVLQELQPKLQEIQGKYKNDRENQAKATMELYKKEKINPFSGCLPLIIQLPILIALYRVFWRGLQPGVQTSLYSFVPYAGQINPMFLGIINLSQPSPLLAVFAGITQFIQSKMVSPQVKSSQGKNSDFSGMMQKQMLYFFPVFTILILWRFPAALAIYWIVTTLFSIFQQYLIFKPRAKA